jgi:Tfp pilus assembly protein PilF
MPPSPFRTCLAALLLAVGGVAFAPSSAETPEELDRLSDLSADEEAGINAATEQAERGEYLEALATLERVLAVHPKSRAARLIHAVYLCRIDDRRGGLVELDRLKEKHYEREQLAEARAICAPGGR